MSAVGINLLKIYEWKTLVDQTMDQRNMVLDRGAIPEADLKTYFQDLQSWMRDANEAQKALSQKIADSRNLEAHSYKIAKTALDLLQKNMAVHNQKIHAGYPLNASQLADVFENMDMDSLSQ